jgi:beta-phosphoglucomutase
MTSEPAAVIFDMDGVLIDSYHAHLQSWQEAARVEGLTITEEQFAATFGKTSRESIRLLWRDRHFTEIQIKDFDHRKEAAFRRIITARFPVMPGAMELLNSLDEAGFLLAIGSSGPPENVDLVLDKLGVRPLLSAVVNGADVTRGKPDPQVFLIAAQRLGVAPARCVVVEDAALGIEAADAAGMKAIGLASTGRTRQSLAAADMVVDRLAEITPAAVRSVLLTLRVRGPSRGA